MAGDSRETVIRIDHDTKRAQVWTQNRALCNRLKRMGAKELERQAKGEWFDTPAEWWRPRRRRSASRPENAAPKGG